MPEQYDFVTEEIGQRLVERFGLREVSARNHKPLYLPYTVHLVSQIDSLLEDLELLYFTFEATAPAAWKTGYTVPITDRLKLYTYYIYRSTGSTAEVDKLGVNDGTRTGAIHSFTASSTEMHQFPQPIEIDRSWIIQNYVSTSNAGDYFTVLMIVKRMKAWTTT